jgi:hypothetical protein
MEDSSARDLLSPHPLIVTATKLKTGARRLYGFVGEAPSSDTVRIFRNLSMEEYWDVSRSDILSAEEVPARNGCVALLVRSDARLRHTHVRQAGESSGLRGDLLRRATARPRGRGLSSRGFGRVALGWTITVTIVTIISDDQGGDDDPDT